MKTVVCVKQVPSVEGIEFDNERKTIIREGVSNEVNPFDRRAVGQAVTLRDTLGGEVVAVTMGPPQADAALRECLAIGADRAVHLNDRAFAGSDTLATSRALAAFLKKEGFDLVFCGKYSIDAETGQVGPEVAALLGIPQVTGATGISINPDTRTATVQRESDDGLETVEVTLPVLLTAAERLCKPPKVTPDMLAAVKDREITVLTPTDIGLDSGDVGLAGSPTWVSEIYSVKSERDPVTIETADPVAAAQEIMQLLLERGALQADRNGPSRPPLPAPLEEARDDRAIWVVAEVAEGKVRESTYELLAGAVNVAQQVGGTVAALAISTDGESVVADLAAHGAQTVYVAADASVESYSPELYGHILAEAIRAHCPWAVLAPASSRGRDYTPRAAAELGLGLTGDVVGLEVSDEGLLRQLKPAFGGTIIAPILSRTMPQVATVRPGMIVPYAPDTARQAEVVRLAVSAPSVPMSRIVSREVQGGAAAVELDHADVVVCVGAGIGGPENLHFAEDLADALGGTIGATRKVVDNGWLPRQFQIGLTGKVLAPRLYIGVAVQGAFNHMIGMQRAQTVVAINKDPDALIMWDADIAVVGDYQEIVPALAAAVREARAASVQ